jgi:hypothetical protein
VPVLSRITINLAPDEVIVREGTYRVWVADVEVRLTKGEFVPLKDTTPSTETLYLSWRLQIAEGDHKGQMVWMVSSLKEGMRRHLRSTFAAVGVDVDGEVAIDWESDRDLLKGTPLTSPDLVGREALAVVVHDEWEGEPRAKARRLIKEQA